MINMSVKRAWHSRSYVNLGKSGLTDNVVNEIKRRLKKEKFLKVRILKNCPLLTNLDRRRVAKYVAEKVNATLIGVRGYTFVLRSKEFKKQ